ncbi:MAG: S41 family peptidase [Desulfobacterium sp.]|nr:S41 family peptidase [Desulfobacterium sp.]
MFNRGIGRTRLWLPVIASALVIIVGGGFYNSPMAGDEKTYQSLKLFSEVLEEIEANYVDSVDSDKLIQSAIKGMVSSLDPHSTFMPPEAFDELQDDTKGEFGGIGIVISMKDGLLVVVSPIEGTPAYRAGIMAGDVIVKIDGESTRDMELWESVKRMRGPTGDDVVLTVVRPGAPDPLEYILKRDIIPMESVRSTTLKPGYGYLWITNFRANTAEDVEKALAELESHDVPLKGLVMDLRNNPGGLLNQANDVSDLFLERGTIVSIKGRLEQHTEVFEAHPSQTLRAYPLVVLINGGSASASEIVAGALQDHGRALILGTTSFGKGSVQSVKPLKEGFGLKYTIARYYTPNGRSIQAEGIKPDIIVPFSLIEDKEEQASETAFDRLVREKDLKNHLEPETPGKKSEKKNENDPGTLIQDQNQEIEPVPGQGMISLDRLNHDAQVQRALEILISYGVFSTLNKSMAGTN